MRVRFLRGPAEVCGRKRPKELWTVSAGWRDGGKTCAALRSTVVQLVAVFAVARRKTAATTAATQQKTARTHLFVRLFAHRTREVWATQTQVRARINICSRAHNNNKKKNVYAPDALAAQHIVNINSPSRGQEVRIHLRPHQSPAILSKSNKLRRM